MGSRSIKIFIRILVVVLLLSACTKVTQTPKPTFISPTATSSATLTVTPEILPSVTPTTSSEEPIYLSIIWHQHQPVDFKDPKPG